MIWFETEGKSKTIVKRALLCGTLAVSLVILTITQSAIPALVMCYGDNGHRAVEIAHDDMCRQAGQDIRGQTHRTNAKSAFGEGISPGRHSTTCLDIPLGNDVVAQRTFSLRKSLTHLIRLALAVPTSSIAFTAGSAFQSISPFFGFSPPPEIPALTMLSTVVLLS